MLFDALASGLVKHRHVADHTPIAEGRCVLQSVNVRVLDEADQGEDEDWAREVCGVGEYCGLRRLVRGPRRLKSVDA